MVITSTAASSVVEDVPAPPKRFGPPVKAIKNSFHALAAEPTFCHQCRRTTQHDKMRCTVIKESGDLCGKRFCRNCVDKRYPDIEFDSYARVFTCPKCSDTCNCTACCGRRGEQYVSGLIGPAASGREPPLRSRKTKAKSQQVPPSPPLSPSLSPDHAGSQEPLPANFDHANVGGSYWGSVYTVTGERVGGAFVGDDNEAIVVKNSDGMPTLRSYASIPNPTFDPDWQHEAASGGAQSSSPELSDGEARGGLSMAQKQQPSRVRPPPRERTYIGSPPPSVYKLRHRGAKNHPEARPGARLFIGNWQANQEFRDDWQDVAGFDSRSSTLSPPPESDVESGASPAKGQLSQQELMFLCAQALHEMGQSLPVS